MLKTCSFGSVSVLAPRKMLVLFSLFLFVGCGRIKSELDEFSQQIKLKELQEQLILSDDSFFSHGKKGSRDFPLLLTNKNFDLQELENGFWLIDNRYIYCAIGPDGVQVKNDPAKNDILVVLDSQPNANRKYFAFTQGLAIEEYSASNEQVKRLLEKMNNQSNRN